MQRTLTKRFIKFKRQEFLKRQCIGSKLLSCKLHIFSDVDVFFLNSYVILLNVIYGYYV